MIEAIKRHPKRTLVVIFFLIFIVIVIAISNLVQTFFRINIINIVNSDEVQQILIFGISLDNWCTLLTMFGVVIGAGWGLIQYDRNTKLRQQEKASEIAEKFSDEIINKLSVISYVLMHRSEFKTILEKINPDKLSTFSQYEIIEISNDKSIFNKFNLILSSKNTQRDYEYYLHTKYNEDEIKSFDSNFVRLVESTLNKLEAICMNISSQAAGSQYIYQSLHQILLYNIHILSILIAQNNVNNFDKYFVNVIEVYNMWNTQKQKDKAIFHQTAQKVKKLEDKRNNEIKKLLNQKPRTV